MKEKETKGRKTLLAIAVAVAACASMNSCAESTQARSLNAESVIAARLKAEKVNRYGHSYVYFYTKGDFYTPVNVLHDPDCPCQKGGAR